MSRVDIKRIKDEMKGMRMSGFHHHRLQHGMAWVKGNLASSRSTPSSLSHIMSLPKKSLYVGHQGQYLFAFENNDAQSSSWTRRRR
jgi:hypothetical protein